MPSSGNRLDEGRGEGWREEVGEGERGGKTITTSQPITFAIVKTYV